VAGRIRHEWYQSAGTVVVSVLVKKAAREDVSVQFGPRTLDVDVKLPAVGTTYNLDLDLCDEIVPGECKYEVLGSKVEITLKKRSAGVKWATLEWTGSEAHAGAMAAGVAGVAVTAAGERPDAGAGSGAKTQGRGYRDWDKLAVEIAEEEKNEKLEGDQALNKLFQDIFANADEDTRRAMNKSFVESGGTVLSTNWKEVGAKTVECTPPDGLEVKRFEH
jgi:suppressor of G2 allele of SKP1